MNGTVQIPISELSPDTSTARGLKNNALADIMQDIVYTVPGCSDLMVRKILQDVSRDFFRRTGAWTHEIVLDAIAGQDTYRLQPPYSADILTIKRVLVLGVAKVPCAGAASFYLSSKTSGKEYLVRRDSEGPAVIVLDSAPTAGDIEAEAGKENGDTKIRVLVSLYPNLSTDEIPDSMISAWGGAIVHGTRARLMIMSNRPWSDKESAQIEAIEYNHELSRATIERCGGLRENGMTALSKIEFF